MRISIVTTSYHPRAFYNYFQELQAALKSNGLLLTTTLATPPWAAAIYISDLIDLFDYWFILPIEYYGVKSNKIMSHAPMETTETIGVVSSNNMVKMKILKMFKTAWKVIKNNNSYSKKGIFLFV